MIRLGDSPVTLDTDDPVERAMTAVAVERRRRRNLAAEWDDRFDFPFAVLLDLLDDLEGDLRFVGGDTGPVSPGPSEGQNGRVADSQASS